MLIPKILSLLFPLTSLAWGLPDDYRDLRFALELECEMTSLYPKDSFPADWNRAVRDELKRKIRLSYAPASDGKVYVQHPFSERKELVVAGELEPATSFEGFLQHGQTKLLFTIDRETLQIAAYPPGAKGRLDRAIANYDCFER